MSANDTYRMPEKTCQQHLEDMVELAVRSGFSDPEYAGGVLAELIVSRGLQRHAAAVGTIMRPVRLLKKILELMKQPDQTNKKFSIAVFDMNLEIRKALGEP